MEKAVAILFANLKGNLGDMAILEANLIYVSEAYPGHRIDVWTSGFLSIDQARLQSFIEAGAPAFHLRGVTSDHPLRRWRKHIRSSGLERTLQPILIACAQRQFASRAKKFSQYAGISVVGGDQFDAAASAAMFGTLKAIAKVNPRILNFPISVNPRTQRINSPSLLRQCFAPVSGPLLVRDEVTLRFLQGLGIDCIFGGDSVLSMLDRIRRVPQSDRPAGIVVAVTKTAPDDPSHLARLLASLASLTLPVTTLTTTPSADAAFLDQRRSGIAYSAPGTWQEAVAELRSATLVVSNRFHCILLAAAVGTPVLAVCNRAKIVSIRNEAALPFWAESLEDTTASLVQDALEGAAIQRAALTAFLEAAQARATSPRRL
jgi:polysaccharide pyruvyl transferase WcaK-like protein